MSTTWTSRTVAALALAGVTALTACSAPGGSAASEQPAEPTSAATLGSDPVTITLYDGAGLKTVDDALIAAFTEQYPNVTVETRYDPDDVQATNAPRVLASDDPPDVARINALSDIVGDGLLAPVTGWAELYGWDSIPAGQMANYTVDADGVRGSGTQYTVASGFTVTGFYYDETLLAQLGIDAPPTTIDDLEADLAAAQAAGITPIMAGNQTGQVMTTVQFLLNDALGRDAVNGWIFHQAGATIDTPEAADAVQTVGDWAAAGYFGSDTNGLDATTAKGQFIAGDALFYASGNWDAASLQEQMGDTVGFVLPPVGDGGSQLAMSDPLSNFGIPAKSDQKDAAAAFLNFLLSPEARQIVVDNGFAPSGAGDAADVEEGSLNASVQQAFAQLVEADGQVQYVQNATNGATAQWNAQVQLLVAGQTTGEQMVAAVQASYEEDLG